ncbi:Ribosome biogenesis protein WDR12 [Babesia sp. Xinjiang]|uniref:Ribosome biogenesis protein WDR12 n=1 Tax=Babesia sp. Xinjiang TaxID=462227 RepID=UPI000A219F67|nr:Ribosome biogenesis protein WDR12 [Babesia sp. Xinjiang]ORM39973.1 Ribosome biogenesis protein WDR12 [Babesia sp. Xinjiang]
MDMDNDHHMPLSAAEIHAELENGTSQEYDLQDTSFMLPTAIDRAGLSRMINDLLGLEKHVAFDILFRDEPLRTTLAEKLAQHKVQSETTIKLVYTLAVTEPEATKVDNLNDWISGISFDGHIGHVVTSCFDGNVALYSADNLKKVAEFTTEEGTASAVAMHSSSDMATNVEIVCGHMNGSLEVYSLDITDYQPRPTLVTTSQSDTDTIVAIAIDPKGTLLASAGHGKDILVYDNIEIKQRIKNNEIDIGKRRKRSIDSDVLEPIVMLTKHTKTVTALKFVELEVPVLISGSIDGHIALWDVRLAAPLCIYACGRAITCLDSSDMCAEIYTGHEEGTIAIWELRNKWDGEPPKSSSDVKNSNVARKASTAMFDRAATAIKANVKHTNLLSAVSLDGTAVLLDKRFVKIPLQTVTLKCQCEPDRCTGTCWMSSHELMCTTATGQLHKIAFRELA